MRARRIAVVVVLALLLTGCGAEELVSLRMPMCGEPGARTTFLMAQAVPDAALVPCIDEAALPGDLFMEVMRIDSGGARFAFVGDWPVPDSEVASRVDVRFTPACDAGDAVAVPSDETDTRRLERVDGVAAGYAGERFYTFDGGCVTYRFDVPAEGWSAFVHEVSQAWSFMPRADVVRLHGAAFDACGWSRAYAELVGRPCDG